MLLDPVKESTTIYEAFMEKDEPKKPHSSPKTENRPKQKSTIKKKPAPNDQKGGKPLTLGEAVAKVRIQ